MNCSGSSSSSSPPTTTSSRRPYTRMTTGKVYLDVAYAGVNSHPSQRLDLFLPVVRTGVVPPLLVFVHGGAWRDVNQQKAQHQTMAKTLSAASADGTFKGTAVALLNYRLSNATTKDVLHPDHINDVNNALGFLLFPDASQPWAKSYNTSRVVVAGHSVGAHMTLSQALDPARALVPGVGPKAAEISAWNQTMQQAGTQDEILPLMPSLPRGREKVKAWIGISGIYSITSMLQLHPSYMGFVEQAFGIPASRSTNTGRNLTDYSRYQVASSQAWPVAPGGYAKNASGPTYYFLHSREDELLSYNESIATSTELKKQVLGLSGARVEIDTTSVRGTHNGCLQTTAYFNYLRKVVQAEA